MPPATKKTSKPIFKAEIPFTATQWPNIGQKHQEAILDLLCSLLEPLGHHRQTHIHPSRGKKRKRGPKQSANTDSPVLGTEPIDTSPPPPPELSSHLLIGLNSITRHLTILANHNAPPTMAASPSAKKGEMVVEEQESTLSADKDSSTEEQNPDEHHLDLLNPRKKEEDRRPLSLLIIPHPTPSASLPHAHLPTLVYLSTIKHSPPTRLICLPSVSEAKLANALHIPRVGALGIVEGAPGAGPLIEYAREHVGVVECAWVEEALKAEWQGVKTSVQMS